MPQAQIWQMEKAFRFFQGWRSLAARIWGSKGIQPDTGVAHGFFPHCSEEITVYFCFPRLFIDSNLNSKTTVNQPNPAIRLERQPGLRHRVLWALAWVMLLELAVFLIFRNVGSYVFTENDGTWAQELWSGEDEDSPDYKKADPVRPYLVKLNSSGEPARLFIRYAAGCGNYYMGTGKVCLNSASGKTLWSDEFEGFTDSIGPDLFACAFADADGDGHAEVFYRHVDSDYKDEDIENGPDCSWKLGPLQVQPLEGDNHSTPHTLRSFFVTRIMAIRTAIPLLDWYEKLAIFVLPYFPPIAWLGIFFIGWKRKSANRILCLNLRGTHG